MKPNHARLLTKAVRTLEHDSFSLRVIDFVGTPLDAPLKLLTADTQRDLDTAMRSILSRGLRWVNGTLFLDGPPRAEGWLTQVAAVTTGFVAGVFGVLTLPLELPIITFLSLRAIAEVGERGGFPEDPALRRIECLFVMALASPVRSPSSESAYWSTRDTYQPLLMDAARAIVLSGSTSASGHAMTALLARTLGTFGTTLSEHMIARAVPIVGGFSGAAMNFFLTSHYRRVAAAHFTILTLEKIYGTSTIRKHYHHAIKTKTKAKRRGKKV